MKAALTDFGSLLTFLCSSAYSLSPFPCTYSPSNTIPWDLHYLVFISHPSCSFFTIAFAKHNNVLILSLPVGPPLTSACTPASSEAGGGVGSWKREEGSVGGEGGHVRANTHVVPIPLTPVRRKWLVVALTPCDTSPWTPVAATFRGAAAEM